MLPASRGGPFLGCHLGRRRVVDLARAEPRQRYPPRGWLRGTAISATCRARGHGLEQRRRPPHPAASSAAPAPRPCGRPAPRPRRAPRPGHNPDAASASAAGMETISPAILAKRLARAHDGHEAVHVHRADVPRVIPAVGQRLQHARRTWRAGSRASRSGRARAGGRPPRCPPPGRAGGAGRAAGARRRRGGCAWGCSARARVPSRWHRTPPEPARRSARRRARRVSSRSFSAPAKM